MNWWTYIWIGIRERIRFVWYYDVSKTCIDCEHRHDNVEHCYCDLLDEYYSGYYRPRSCKLK